MYLKILGHPIFPNLNFHMPMIVDLSHPLIMLQGENGSGKSTLLHSIYHAFRGEQVPGYIYRLEPADKTIGECPELVLGLIRDQLQRGYDPVAEAAALEKVRETRECGLTVLAECNCFIGLKGLEPGSEFQLMASAGHGHPVFEGKQIPCDAKIASIIAARKSNGRLRV